MNKTKVPASSSRTTVRRLVVVVMRAMTIDVLGPLLHHIAASLGPRGIILDVVASGSAVEALPKIDHVESGRRIPPDLPEPEALAWALAHSDGDYVWPLRELSGTSPRGLEALAETLTSTSHDVVIFDFRRAYDGGVSARSMLGAVGDSAGSLASILRKVGLFSGPAAGSSIVFSRRAVEDVLGACIQEEPPIGLLQALLLRSPRLGAAYVPAAPVTEGPLATHWPSAGWSLGWLSRLAQASAEGELQDEFVATLLDRWPDGRRQRWILIAAHDLLETLSQSVVSDRRTATLAAEYLARLLPEALELQSLLHALIALGERHATPLHEIAANSRRAYSRRDATSALDLGARAAAWRRRFNATPWFEQAYVETFRGYDLYDIGWSWVAARTTFAWLEEALDATEPTSVAPGFFVASDRSELELMIAREPITVDAPEMEAGGGLARLSRWRRLTPPPKDPAPHVVAAAPAAAPIIQVHADAERVRSLEEEGVRLRSELSRQDAELSELYASTSWRVTEPLRRAIGLVRRRTTGALDPGRPGPVLYSGAKVDLSSHDSDGYLLRGFSGPEPWGRWTDGHAAVFRARHEAKLRHATLEILPFLVWVRDGTAVRVTLSINGQPGLRLAPTAGQPIRVDLPERILRPTGLLDLCFRIVDPKAVSETPTADRRQLGLGLESMTFTWRDSPDARSAAL